MTKEEMEAVMDDLDRRMALLELSKEELVNIIRKLEEENKELYTMIDILQDNDE